VLPISLLYFVIDITPALNPFNTGVFITVRTTSKSVEVACVILTVTEPILPDNVSVPDVLFVMHALASVITVYVNVEEPLVDDTYGAIASWTLATFTIVAPVYVIVLAVQDIFAAPFPRLPTFSVPSTLFIEASPAVIVELANVPTNPEPPELVGHDVHPPQYPPPAPPFAQPSDPRAPPFHPPTEHVFELLFAFAYPNEPATTPLV